MTTNSTPIPNVAVNGGYVGFVSAHSGFMLLKRMNGGREQLVVVHPRGIWNVAGDHKVEFIDPFESQVGELTWDPEKGLVKSFQEGRIYYTPQKGYDPAFRK